MPRGLIEHPQMSYRNTQEIWPADILDKSPVIQSCFSSSHSASLTPAEEALVSLIAALTVEQVIRDAQRATT